MIKPVRSRRRTAARGAIDVLLAVARPLTSVFGWVANLGVKRYPPDTQRRLKIVNVFSFLVVISTCIYAVQIALSGKPEMTPVVLLNLALAFVVALVPVMHRFNDIAGNLLLIVSEFIALVGFTFFFGRQAGTPLQYVIAAAAPFVIFDRNRVWLVLAIVATGLALHLYAWFHFPASGLGLAIDQPMLDSLYVQGAITTFGLIAASVYYAFTLVERAKAETETVLRNVLPDSVVERLKARPDETIADGFAEASVLFADITGFVGMARSLGPEKTVALLNRLVVAFDELADRHGVEKIKTIGDAYMVASGVPIARPDHAIALASMALDLIAVVGKMSAEEQMPINVRIGMAAGPMMAGVIGRNKFSYDVWGDPVNLASRLEQASVPGRITVCPRCHAALQDAFDMETRDTIEIKGIGPQNAWFLVRRKSDALNLSNAASRRA